MPEIAYRNSVRPVPSPITDPWAIEPSIRELVFSCERNGLNPLWSCEGHNRFRLSGPSMPYLTLEISTETARRIQDNLDAASPALAHAWDFAGSFRPSARAAMWTLRAYPTYWWGLGFSRAAMAEDFKILAQQVLLAPC